MFSKIKSKYHDMNIEKMKELREKWAIEDYEMGKSDINSLSYWFPKIKDVGFKVPDTIVIPLTYERYKWLCSDNYSDDAILSFTEELKDYLSLCDFNLDRKLFLKTGVYSNKFNFESCILGDIDTIGIKFLNIFYDSMLVGKGKNSELVVREYISAKEERPKIYNGMPLNTEFRLFYDFDNKKVLGVFNYWDRATMEDVLNMEGRHCLKELLEYKKSDYTTFKSIIDVIESEFNELKDDLIESANIKLSKVDGLDGIWSVDFMYVDGDMYLIDMALGHRSYYRGKLQK